MLEIQWNVASPRHDVHGVKCEHCSGKVFKITILYIKTDFLPNLVIEKQHSNIVFLLANYS